jgi:hypothetical protein
MELHLLSSIVISYFLRDTCRQLYWTATVKKAHRCASLRRPQLLQANIRNSLTNLCKRVHVHKKVLYS